MLACYDPATGDVLYTILLAEGAAVPPGAFVDVGAETLDPALWRVEDGQVVPRADALDRQKRTATAEVNRIAGEVRARFVTVIPAQDMVYLRKEAEARAFLAALQPDPADYPYIAAEVGITGATATQVAQVYVNLAAILDASASQLETARLGTIAVIEGAVSREAIAAAMAAYQTALEAFG